MSRAFSISIRRRRSRGEAQARYLDLLDRLNEAHLAEHPGETRSRGAHRQLRTRRARCRPPRRRRSTFPTRPTRRRSSTASTIRRPRTTARAASSRGASWSAACVSCRCYHRQSAWDHHRARCQRAARQPATLRTKPRAALVTDLKQRGLLDSTVVHWGGEMGRLPVLQNDAGRDKWGRDHNTYGFSHVGRRRRLQERLTSTARPTNSATRR